MVCGCESSATQRMMETRLYKYCDSGRNFGRPNNERWCFTNSSTRKELDNCLTNLYNDPNNKYYYSVTN
jgi:hypothetical protein